MEIYVRNLISMNVSLSYLIGLKQQYAMDNSVEFKATRRSTQITP
jgi:hypothetical protein